LALQRLHGLADDDTSFQIIDRHSFRAFLGLTAADAVPDGQTIADYREELMKSGSFERLFHLFLGHLQKSHGLGLGREGVMIDATFVEVPKQRNNREQNAMIAEGVIPEELLTHPKKRAHKDTDARWTKKNQISYYGYKDHVKVDVADKLILDGLTTSAEVHDSQPTAELIKEGDKVLWADSAYTGGKIEEDLAAKKVEPQRLTAVTLTPTILPQLGEDTMLSTFEIPTSLPESLSRSVHRNITRPAASDLTR
jgi:IS5 family transposase